MSYRPHQLFSASSTLPSDVVALALTLPVAARRAVEGEVQRAVRVVDDVAGRDVRVVDLAGGGRVVVHLRADVADAGAEREARVVGRGALDRGVGAEHEVLRDRRALDGRVGAGRDAQAVLAEQRARGEHVGAGGAVVEAAVAGALVVDALRAADDLAGGDDTPVDRARRRERRVVAFRAVDQDADLVELLDAGAVDAQAGARRRPARRARW